MALIPKRSKYRKQFRGRNTGVATRAVTLEFGEYGLKALTPGWVTSRQIEAARRTMTRYTQKGGRVFIRIFPDKPITKKPAETRMGGGKGDVYEHVAVIHSGRILFEMSGVSQATAHEALLRAAAKIALAVRIISKN